MILNKDNFYAAVDNFTELKEKITSVTEDSFRRVYGSDAAGKAKNVIYLLRCEREVSRLKGESNILYIGQTERSFRARYASFARLHSTSVANKLKFTHIIDNYGPISVSFSDFSAFGDTLLQAEGQLLWWYFQNHCEYPPINYTKTSIRRDEVHN